MSIIAKTSYQRNITSNSSVKLNATSKKVDLYVMKMNFVYITKDIIIILHPNSVNFSPRKMKVVDGGFRIYS